MVLPVGVFRVAVAGRVPDALSPRLRLFDADAAGEVLSAHGRMGAGGGDSGGFINLARHQAGVLCTVGTQAAGDFAGVDVADADDVVRAQIVAERAVGAPGAVSIGGVAHDEAGGLQRGGFDIQRVDAGVADVRVGEGDDLSGVGRVGEDFLVAGHGGVEDEFAAAAARGTDGAAAKHTAVGEGEDGVGLHDEASV